MKCEKKPQRYVNSEIVIPRDQCDVCHDVMYLHKYGPSLIGLKTDSYLSDK
jgi:hypothetical protein